MLLIGKTKQNSKKSLNQENTQQIENNTKEMSDEDSSKVEVDETLKAKKENDIDSEKIDSTNLSETAEADHTDRDVNEGKRILTCILIGIYVFIQGFLPFSHFITKVIIFYDILIELSFYVEYENYGSSSLLNMSMSTTKYVDQFLTKLLILGLQ